MKQFPVIIIPDLQAKINSGEYTRGCLTSVPWKMLEDKTKHVKENFDSTLEELAEAGGLDPAEILSVYRRKPWIGMDAQVAMVELIRAVEQWKNEQERAFGYKAKVFYRFVNSAWEETPMVNMKPGDIILQEEQSDDTKDCILFKVTSKPKLVKVKTGDFKPGHPPPKQIQVYQVEATNIVSLDKLFKDYSISPENKEIIRAN